MTGLSPPVPDAMARMASIRARFVGTPTPLGSNGAASADVAKSLSDSSFSSLLDSLSGSDSTSTSGVDDTTSNQLTTLLASSATAPAPPAQPVRVLRSPPVAT